MIQITRFLRKEYAYILLASLLFFLISCSGENSSETPKSAYERQIFEWRNSRIKELKSPTGWLSMAGLHWLRGGVSTFGSSPSNDIVFPPNAANQIGAFVFQGDSVVLRVMEGIDVHMNGNSIREIALERNSQSSRLWHNSIFWNAIERGGRTAIRVGDSLREERVRRINIPYYEVDSSFKVQAIFIPFDTPKSVFMRNMLEMNIEVKVEGTLNFKLAGKGYSLLVMDGGQDSFFLVFSDETTGLETYSGGRYIYPPRPRGQNLTFIDFNKAYNPPCVFTEFATCLLPTRENHINVEVRAGERDYGH